MNTWPALPLAAKPSTLQRCMVGLIGSVGCSDFAQQALQALNGALAAASWSVYQRFIDREPVMHLSASYGVADTTGACFAAYRDGGLYRRDRILDAVRTPVGVAVMLRMHASQAPNAEHREAIYRRHGVVERLSVAERRADGSLLAVNLYHHQHQGRFGEGELANFAELAPQLLAGVSRHLELRACAPASPRAALLVRCARLTARELDVLERLLKGMSYDGIAADIGLSLATVKTYRARAFERLGIHFKSELFAAFLPS